MKVLLINPYTVKNLIYKEWIPSPSLYYLAETLVHNNINVEILDLNTYHLSDVRNSKNVAKKYIISKIKEMNPSFIGIGCLFSGHIEQVIYYSRIIKDNFKNIKIIIGGIHPTIFYKDILLNIKEIDYVALGEGENTLLKLVNGCPLKSIENLAYRINEIINVNKKSFIEKVDIIPFPRYSMVDIKKYYIDTSNWNNPKKLDINFSLPIISSRGCPMQCNFCSLFLVNGKKWRSRSVNNIVDEIEFLNKERNCNHFSFYDDNFTLNKSRIRKMHDEILKRKINIHFETPNGLYVHTLDEDMVNMLMEMGLTRITLAIESGNDFIRNKIMKKNISEKKIYDVVKICKKFKDLKIRAYFIMGMPEETMESLQDTYEMIEKIDISKPQVSNLLPFPGTRVFEQCLKDNLFVDKNITNNLWKTDKLYYTGNKTFFIKPYKLEIKDLIKYRLKFDMLVNKMINKNNG